MSANRNTATFTLNGISNGQHSFILRAYYDMGTDYYPNYSTSAVVVNVGTSSSSSISSSSQSSSSVSSSSRSSISSSPSIVIQRPEDSASPTDLRETDESDVILGEFTVSNSGSAQYRIPLFTLKGTGDLFPKVELMYNSQSGNGVAGVGWNISGLSSISRCRKTLHQDRIKNSISFTNEDQYCLDGKRLIAINAASGIYKLEIDSGFTQIVRYGSEANPDYFTVIYKDGSIGRYGASGTVASEQKGRMKNGAVSTSILTWGLDRFEDARGNIISYGYKLSDDDYLLGSISYGYYEGIYSPISTGWTYRLAFGYEDRKDIETTYIAGNKFLRSKRLKNITFTSQGDYDKTLRTYSINYNEGLGIHSSDKLSRLTSIQECSGAYCKQPTRFNWQVSNGSFDIMPKSFVLGAGVKIQKIVNGDFNGDGSIDIAWIQSNGEVRYAINSNGQLSHGIFSNGSYAIGVHAQSGFSSSYQLAVVDFNRDGRSDLALKTSQEEPWQVYVSVSNSGGAWLLSSNSEVLTFNGEDSDNYSFTDRNGDGLIDGINSSGFQQVLVNGYQGWSKKILEAKEQFPSNYLQYEEKLTEPFLRYDPNYANYYLDYQIQKLAYDATGVADFNGDGEQDLLAYVNYLNYSCPGLIRTDTRLCANGAGYVPFSKEFVAASELRSLPTGFYNKPYGIADLSQNYWRSATHRFVDINKDGLTDIAYLEDTYVPGPTDFESGLFTYGGGNWYYVLNTGNGFSEERTLVIPPKPSNPMDATNLNPTNFVRHDNKADFADVNHDGYLDFIYFNFQKMTTPADRTETNQLWVRYWNPEQQTYSQAVPFCPKGNHNCLSFYDQFTLKLVVVAAQNQVKNNNFWDMNSDGLVDYVYYQNGNIDVYLANPELKPVNKISQITDGHGLSTYVEYSPLSTTENYVQLDIRSSYCSSLPECWKRDNSVTSTDLFYSKIRNPFVQENSLGKLVHTNFVKNGMDVVTKVSITSPTAGDYPGYVNTDAKVSNRYFYANARIQAGGRGFLGFEKTMVVDDQTGIRTTSEFRQDWPFIGVEIKNEKWASDTQKISSRVNNWKFRSWNSNSSTVAFSSGTIALGSIQPYLSKSTESEYMPLSGSYALIKTVDVSTESIDSYMNVLQQKEIVKNASGLVVGEKLITKNYGYSTIQQEMGLSEKITVTETRGSYTETRTSSFTYFTSGTKKGLIDTETIEPNTSLQLSTSHIYDEKGNEIQTRITDKNGNIRVSPRLEYDERGRYVVRQYENFADSSGNPQEYLSIDKQTIDEYGNALNLKIRKDSATWLNARALATPAGNQYFESDATGKWSIKTRHRFSGLNAICSQGAVVYDRYRFSDGQERIVCFDVMQRETRKATKGMGGKWIFIDTEYNNQGLIARQSDTYFENDSSNWNEFEYDIHARVTKIKSTKKGISQISYYGLTKTTTDQRNVSQYETMNEFGLTSRIVNSSGYYIDFTYNAAGRLDKTTTKDGFITATKHNVAGQKFLMIDPNGGHRNYTYNGFGELETEKDANGNTTTSLYDFKGRLKKRTDKKPNSVITGNAEWFYDTAQYGFGQLYLVSDTSTNYSQQHSYDQFGRTQIIKSYFPGKNNVIQFHFEKYEYDAIGRISKYFDSARLNPDFSNNIIQYGYDQYGYRNKIVDAKTAQTLHEIKTINAEGNLLTASFGNNVLSQSDQYYAASGLMARQRVTSASFMLGGIPLQDRQYQWDSVGNLQYRIVGGAGQNGTSFFNRNIQEDFSYDSENRLSAYSVTAQASVNVQYYDNGNIKYKSDVSSSNYQYANSRPNAVSQINTKTFQYDNVGNMISDGTRSMVYNAARQLESVTNGNKTTKFFYTPDRTLFKREDDESGSSTVTLMLGSVEKQYYADGTYSWKRFIDKHILHTQTFNSTGVMVSNKQQYLLYDHLGSLSYVTNEDGTPSDVLDFDPWGKRRHHVDLSGMSQSMIDSKYLVSKKPHSSRGFTNHEMIDSAGLIHMKGRIQEPSLGVFLQVDPVVENVRLTAAFNRYSYVQNNPLNATDPNGFQSDRKEPDPIGETIINGYQMSDRAMDAFYSGYNILVMPLSVENSTYFAYYAGNPESNTWTMIGATTKKGYENYSNRVAQKGFGQVGERTINAENSGSGKYTIGLAVIVSSRTDPVGHVFNVWRSGDNTTAKGFYPIVKSPAAPGEIRNDGDNYDRLTAGKLIGAIHTVEISKEKYEQSMALAVSGKDNFYNIATRQCAHHGVSIFQLATGIDYTSNDWTTPRELLKEMMSGGDSIVLYGDTNSIQNDFQKESEPRYEFRYMVSPL